MGGGGWGVEERGVCGIVRREYRRARDSHVIKLQLHCLHLYGHLAYKKVLTFCNNRGEKQVSPKKYIPLYTFFSNFPNLCFSARSMITLIKVDQTSRHGT